MKDSKCNTEIGLYLFDSRTHVISNVPVNQTSLSHEKQILMGLEITLLDFLTMVYFSV